MAEETIIKLRRHNKGLVWDYSISPRVLRTKLVETRKLLESVQLSQIAGQIGVVTSLIEDLRSFVWLLKLNKSREENLPIVDPMLIDSYKDRGNIRWQGRKGTQYQVVGLQNYPHLLPDHALNRLAEFSSMADRIEIWIPVQPGVCQVLFVMRVGVYHLLVTDMFYDNPPIRELVIRQLTQRMMPLLQAQYALTSFRESGR